MLDVGTGKGGHFLPPVLRLKVQIFGTHHIADAATLVHFGDASPEAVELLPELVGLVEKYCSAGQEVEHGVIPACDGSVKFPARKSCNPSGADGGFDNFFRA